MPPKELLGKLRKLFKFLGITLFILGVVFWLGSDFWAIRRVSCYANGNPCSPGLWAELMGETSGKNIFLLSSGKLSWWIEQKHPEFFQVKIDKQLPHGLLIEIETRKAVVAVGKEGGDFYLVDKDGVLLEKAGQSPSLPLVLIADGISQNLGDKIEEEIILKEIQILHESQLRLLEPKSAQAMSVRTFEVWFKDNLRVLFSAQKEVKKQLDSLQFILERTKIEGARPKEIDLRFDKPVISK